MNKKFKYKKSLLAAILSATLLAGCDGGGSGSSSDTPPVDSGTGSLPEVKPDPTPNPEPEPVPTKTGYLTLGGSLRVTGDITCNDESSDGFTFTPGDKVTCVAGNNTTIATFDTQSEAARSLRAVEKVSFSLEDAQELAGSDNKKSNALSLVTSMNSCPANTEQVCLEFSSVIESKRFDSLYKQIDLAPEEFKKLVNEEVENNAATDKAPSTHTSPVVPATTPGTKPDLNASFVSANAEQFYQYQPSEIILSEGRLVDSQGDGVVGVNYYTNSGRGVTGENGEFSFSWGETISFGIDTFELGSVRGNKSTIALTELGDEVRGANIDQLIHRYSKAGQNHTRVVPDEVRKVFAEYPNVINEIINLSLPPSSTRVFCAEWPSSTSRRPPDSRTTPSALPFSTVKLPRRLLPVTVAAVLVTSAPPCFRVTFVAVPPAFTCSLPFWLTVVKSARPPSLIICQPSLFTTVPDAVPPLCTYWYPPFSVVSSA